MDEFENYKVKQFTQRKTVIMIAAFYHIYYKDKKRIKIGSTIKKKENLGNFNKRQCATFSEKQEVITQGN